MCTVSMVMDWGKDQFPGWKEQFILQHNPDYEGLRRRVEELEKLLRKAAKYDEDNGEPNCELESKKRALQAMADELGIKIEFPAS